MIKFHERTGIYLIIYKNKVLDSACSVEDACTLLTKYNKLHNTNSVKLKFTDK
jgi:hypothetical protein